MLFAACAFDASKLRRPTSQAQDSAVEYPVEMDGPSGLADVMADANGTPDTVGAESTTAPVSSDGSVPDFAPALDSSEPVDLPVAAEVAGEGGLALDSGGAGGGGNGGAGDPMTGGAGGAGGMSTGGAGDPMTGGAGGAGGVSTGGAGDPMTGGAGGAGGMSTGGVGGSGDSDGGEDAADVPSTGDVPGDMDGPDDTSSTGDGADDVQDVAAADSTDVQGLGDVTAESGDVAEVGASIDPDLVLWYRFDESSGTTAFDSAMSGGAARNATLMTVGTGATALFSTARQVGSHALALTPWSYSPSLAGAYVVMPAFDTLAPNAITIAVWVNLAANTSAQNWERIWDLADSSTAPKWLNLAARNGSGPYGPVFAMSATGHTTAVTERLVAPAALTANVWHHIAIVLPAGKPYTGVMYVDGVPVATNDAMTVHLADIGATANNWFGRSQFTSDPYFNGSLDDFRVYKRALSQQEIAELFALR